MNKYYYVRIQELITGDEVIINDHLTYIVSSISKPDENDIYEICYTNGFKEIWNGKNDLTIKKNW